MLYSVTIIRILSVLTETNIDFANTADLQPLPTLSLTYCYHIVCLLDWILDWVLSMIYYQRHSLNGSLAVLYLVCSFCVLFHLNILKGNCTQENGVLFLSSITCGIHILVAIFYSHIFVIYFTQEVVRYFVQVSHLVRYFTQDNGAMFAYTFDWFQVFDVLFCSRIWWYILHSSQVLARINHKCFRVVNTV